MVIAGLGVLALPFLPQNSPQENSPSNNGNINNVSNGNTNTGNSGDNSSSNTVNRTFPFIPVNFLITKFNNTPYTHTEFASNVRSGGVGKDGIPPIEIPQYIIGKEADSILADTDIVFGLDYQGKVIAFPQYILVWHEIINENIGGVKITFAYCPLTGSAVGYVGHFLTVETSFGVSGNLLNSNLVMYDRDSDSFWPQILGEAINGAHEGEQLQKVQLFFTTWNKWYAQHPDTQVLSENTGHIRNYGYDPYGSYTSSNTYYQTGSPFFPVMTSSDVLSDKTVVYGISEQGSHLGIEKDLLQNNRVLNLNFSNHRIVAFYDDHLDTARIYKSSLFGQDYAFDYVNGSYIDLNTNTTSSIDGSLTIGTLEPIVYFDVMWFSWYAFHPDTTLAHSKP